MEKTINFDFYYGHEAEQFTFYRILVAHGYKQDGIWMIKNPDGKEVEIWQFLKDYAKECTRNNAEIDISNLLLRLMDMLVII